MKVSARNAGRCWEIRFEDDGSGIPEDERLRIFEPFFSTRPASLPGTGNVSEWPTLETLQKDYVDRVMAAVDGNKRRAAQVLGINRRTLYRWLESETEQGND